jgi:hypothetical protein
MPDVRRFFGRCSIGEAQVSIFVHNLQICLTKWIVDGFLLWIAVAGQVADCSWFRFMHYCRSRLCFVSLFINVNFLSFPAISSFFFQ